MNLLKNSIIIKNIINGINELIILSIFPEVRGLKIKLTIGTITIKTKITLTKVKISSISIISATLP
ncbi:MAG: hypothetical protein KJ771_06275 [Nanoarchaeota archaeon]|nr:hypothetical protein [Nanoarchaeota archaeon]